MYIISLIILLNFRFNLANLLDFCETQNEIKVFLQKGGNFTSKMKRKMLSLRKKM